MKVFFKKKKHDYPKRAGDLALAWYAGGNVCIVRKKVKRELQKQNLSIIQINAISRMVWDGLTPPYKKDLAQYALLYKKEYPGLRKRGISSYAVFLMITHALIRRFSFNIENTVLCAELLKRLLADMSVKKAVELKILKRVSMYYQLNQNSLYHLKQEKCKKNHTEMILQNDRVYFKKEAFADG